jgi:hypothetical protein
MKMCAAGSPICLNFSNFFHGDLRLVMAAYAAGERQIRGRGLSYSSEEVYAYVQRIAQQYRAELRRSGVR